VAPAKTAAKARTRRSPRRARLLRDLSRIRIDLDEDLYGRIVEDMRRHGGMHAPGKVWRMEALFPDSPESRERPSFADMVAPWIGAFGKEASPERVREVREFLKPHLRRVPAPLRNRLRMEARMPVVELRTVHDVALMTSHLRRPEGQFRILEVGAGYGRLAEAFFNLKLDVRYVIVDAVPATLYYAYEYLRRALPRKKVAFYYKDGPEAAAAADCYVLPTWRIGDIELEPVDLAINIASFQEMTMKQVRYYLQLFDRTVTDGGGIYISNSRVYGYPREYTYPSNWKILFKHTTPFSVTLHYPVEIFEKTGADWSANNVEVERRYFLELYEDILEDRERLRAAVARERETSTRRAKELERLRERLGEQRDRIASLAEERRRLAETIGQERRRSAETIGRLRAQNEKLRAEIERLSHTRERP
jgi:SAM-dependent methyltransferase